jgi:hypothetical protein
MVEGKVVSEQSGRFGDEDSVGLISRPRQLVDWGRIIPKVFCKQDGEMTDEGIEKCAALSVAA